MSERVDGVERPPAFGLGDCERPNTAGTESFQLDDLIASLPGGEAIASLSSGRGGLGSSDKFAPPPRPAELLRGSVPTPVSAGADGSPQSRSDASGQEAATGSARGGAVSSAPGSLAPSRSDERHRLVLARELVDAGPPRPLEDPDLLGRAPPGPVPMTPISRQLAELCGEMDCSLEDLKGCEKDREDNREKAKVELAKQWGFSYDDPVKDPSCHATPRLLGDRSLGTEDPDDISEVILDDEQPPPASAPVAQSSLNERPEASSSGSLAASEAHLAGERSCRDVYPGPIRVPNEAEVAADEARLEALRREVGQLRQQDQAAAPRGLPSPQGDALGVLEPASCAGFTDFCDEVDAALNDLPWGAATERPGSGGGGGRHGRAAPSRVDGVERPPAYGLGETGPDGGSCFGGFDPFGGLSTGEDSLDGLELFEAAQQQLDKARDRLGEMERGLVSARSKCDDHLDDLDRLLIECEQVQTSQEAS